MIDELQRTLSLNDKASTETTLRKLQSTMRNNVQANYGARRTLEREPEAAGEPTLMPALAGQALNSWEPRGIARVAGSGPGSVALGMMSNIAGAGPLPAMAIGAADWIASMPRVAGETSHAAGRVAGLLDGVAGAAPAPARRVARAAMNPTTRAVAEETGGAANIATMIDAKGNEYDLTTGRLIKRGGE